MLYYAETFSVPDDGPEAVEAYLNILRALFNLTNATHTNSSARSVTGQFFQQRKSLLATDSIGTDGDNSKYSEDDNAEGVYQNLVSTRMRSLRRGLQSIAIGAGLVEAVPPSPPTRAKEALDEFVRPAWNDFYTDETLRTDPRFASYYSAAATSPLEAYHFYRQIQCEAEQRLMFFEIEAIIKDPTARTAWLLLNTDFGMADMLAGLGLIPCRDRTSEQRPALEIFPAPSPPPPNDDWVKPPSPPAHVYETIVFSTTLSTSAFFFLCFIGCCACFGNSNARDRATSRMVGTGSLRTDGLGWEGGADRSVAMLGGPYYASGTAPAGRPSRVSQQQYTSTSVSVGIDGSSGSSGGGAFSSWSFASLGLGGTRAASDDHEFRKLRHE
jgi:hypothetical protein